MLSPEQNAAFVPIVPNPFITGNPVRNPNLFFGREADFAFARQRLLAETEGGVVLFVGERRSGKTSVLFQILNGRLGDEFLPFFIDMQALAGIANDREFFEGLAVCVFRGVTDERLVRDDYDFSQTHPAYVFDQLLDRVQKIFPERRLIFLFDEAEILHHKVEVGQLSGDVLVYMAAIMESRRLYFFLTGSRHLGETHGEQWRRLIGKATYREISFLGREDALTLIQKPVEGRVFFGDGVVAHIYRLTAGHPYYTQVICTNIVDYLNSVERNAITRSDLDEVIQTIVDNPPPNMVYSWDELTLVQQMTLSLLSEESDDPASFASAEALVDSIKVKNYPLDLTAEGLHGAMETLYQRDILERDDTGAYRFRVYLFCIWIRRARSIWRLVKEEFPQSSRRSFVMWGILVGVVLVGVVVVWMQTRLSEQRIAQRVQAPPVGSLWLESTPNDVAVYIDGEMRYRRTPVMIQALDAGAHRIEVHRSGYYTFEREVTVSANQTDSLRAELRLITGRLSVTSEPSDARVQIDGAITYEGRSPIQHLELPIGAYTVTVQRRGFVTQQQAVAVDTVSEGRVHIVLSAAVGHLFVTSQPPGARIVLDGKTQAVLTPATLKNQSVNSHRVHLELADHAVWDTVVQVRLNRLDTLAAQLEALPSMLSLVSEPMGAAIYFADEDTAVGLTPWTQALRPGRYRIRLGLAGYAAEMLDLSLLPGKTYRPVVVMKPQYGWVRITRPVFGTVVIDESTSQKVPPGDIQLQVGVHMLRTMNAHESKRVKVVEGDTIWVELP